MLQMISEYGSITGMNDEKALTLTDEQISRIQTGSKCLLAGWCLYVTMIFCMKGCMLFVYQRLTYVVLEVELLTLVSYICFAKVEQVPTRAAKTRQNRLGDDNPRIYLDHNRLSYSLYAFPQELAGLSVSWW